MGLKVGIIFNCIVYVGEFVGEFVAEIFKLPFCFLAFCAEDVPNSFHIILNDISQYFITLLILINLFRSNCYAINQIAES